MSYVWNFDVLYSDKANNISVVKASSTPGQVFSNKYGVFGAYPDGLQWLDAGSEVNLLSGEGMFDHTLQPYEKVEYQNVEHYQNPVGILVTVKPSTYYCISDPLQEVCWDGELYQIATGTTESLSDVQGKRLYVAEGEVIVNGTVLKAGKMAHLKNATEVDLVATTDSVVALVYPRDANAG